MSPTIAAAVAIAVLAGAAAGAAAPQPSTHPTWWVERYGPAKLSASTEAAIATAFDRVRRVAGQQAQLLLVEGPPGDPFAFALGGGSVVINRALVTICEEFAGGDPSRRDDLIAFVLAHELSHLLAGDSRPYAGFSGEAELRRVGAEAKQRRELQADARGFELTIRAGYDVATVLEAIERGFFTAIDRDDAAAAARRARVLPAELENLATRAEEYHFGARLVALGRLEDGLMLMGHFAEIYQGRELLNDLGVAHLRSASRLLAACDGSLVTRYRLPTIVDGRSLVERTRLRGAPTRSPCYDDPRFTSHFDTAVELLDRAAKSDTSYLPARLNLIAAQLLGGSSAAAVDAAQKAIEISPDDVQALAGLAVAFAVFGAELGLADWADKALEYLDRADELRPTALAAWNRAAIETRLGRESAAAASWRRAIELEPHGPWADIARERLGLGLPASVPRPPPTAIPPPLPLGAPPGRIEAREVTIGTFRAQLLRHNHARALAIRNTVEVIEAPAPRGWGRSELEARLGPPQAIEATAAGHLIHWPGLMAEEIAGSLTRLVWSTPRPPGPTALAAGP
jgi:tetratricopeptide (TPR) repeat protein